MWDENGNMTGGPINISSHDMEKIFKEISKEELQMVDKIVEFMSKECAAWGNEASMKLLGFEKYGEGWYFPIKVWDGTRNKEGKKKGDRKLTGQTFTKELVKDAGNAVVLEDFFDTVLNHVVGMSLYNTVALPILDMERVLNHTAEKSTVRQARAAIEKTFGSNVVDYIYNWMSDVNGNKQTVHKDSATDFFFRNATKVSVAFKLSVFLKQGTSIVRACQVISPKKIIAAMKSIAHPKKTVAEMQEHIPIAYYKGLGFRNPYTSRDIKTAILDMETVTDKAAFGAYGAVDDFTWGIIYTAVKSEVEDDIKKNNLSIEIGSEEYWNKVRELFDYAIDRTQVVDSVFHRSQIMRSNNPLTKIQTLFMSEPIKSLNMYKTEIEDGFRNQTKFKSISKSTAIFVIGGALLASVGALPMVLKDDEDDYYDDEGKRKSFGQRYLGHLVDSAISELNPLNMVPYLNTLVSIVEGWSQKDVVWENLEKAINQVKNVAKGNGKTWYRNLYDVATAVSLVFGIPYGNAFKEVEGIARTAMHQIGDEYADYLITKSKWSVKDPKNKSKFMKFYDNAIINGHSEEAAEIFSDYYGVENNEGMKAWMKETARLYKATGEDKHFYNSPSDKFKFNGKDIELSGEKYKTYEKDITESFLGLVDDLIKTEHYKGLSDDEKIKELNDLRQWVMFKEQMKYYPVDIADNKHTDEVFAAMDKLYLETGTKPLSELYSDSFTTSEKEKVELTDEEYKQFLDGSYDVLWNIAYEMVSSKQYESLDSEEKLKLYDYLKEYAKETQYSNFAEHEMSGWKKDVFSGEESFINSRIGGINDGYYSDAKDVWKNENFNFDEKNFSKAELDSMNEFEANAAAFYTAHEMGIPYEEGKYRTIQTYQDYLSDVMPIEEFATIRAYAKKIAAMSDGKEAMSRDELQAVLDSTSYSGEVKGALFEAIGNKNWKNPYVGGKVGDGTVFPVITTPPEKGTKRHIPVAAHDKIKTRKELVPMEIYTSENTPKQEEVKVKDEKEDVEINRPPVTSSTSSTSRTSGGGSTRRSYSATNYTVSQSPEPAKQQITIKYDASKYTTRQVKTIRQVESDANSYYNSPRLQSYKNSSLRYMNVFETRLKNYIDLDTYARIRAEAFGDAQQLTATELQKYIAELDYDAEIKEALFEAIGEEDWENPFKE
jgi:hypothetical protein